MKLHLSSESKQNVELLCGEYPEDFQEVDILSDPNFVFDNDVNYSAVQLFDSEGNSVFVNSFLECQHYVKGGWDFTPQLRNESFYHNSLLSFSLLAIFVCILVMKPKFIFRRR